LKYCEIVKKLEEDGWFLEREASGPEGYVMMEYLVVIERAEDGSFSAFVPDLPGCVSCGDSVEEAKALIREAILLHVDSLRQHNEPVPSPSAIGQLITV
jgi:predicted RNase H-like HicB family nuclease